MGIPLLNDLLIIFILSIGIMLICHRLGIPLIVGLLITGIITGPSGLGLVTDMHEVEILAEIGIILLLFEIGIEFSLRSLLRIKRIVLIGGGMQVTVTIFATMLFARLFGIPYNQAVFFGFLVSLSSTALVLKLLQEKALVESPPGQLTLGILIFQDIIIVPLLLFVPILAGGEGNIAIELLWMLGKSVVILGITYLGARYLVPLLLNQIAKTRSREVFLITIVSICFAVAWMTSFAGLSLSLGAFLAGLIISESPYSQQSLGFVVPFKDLFTSIFFISIGMLLNVSAAIQQFWIVLAFALTIVLSKAIITTIAGLLSGSSVRTALIGALMIGQVGEFSFILAEAGHEIHLISDNFYQLFIATTILTMAVTPFFFRVGPMLGDKIVSLLHLTKQGSLFVNRRYDLSTVEEQISKHICIIGYGVNGRHAARAAKKYRIPYLIIEHNPETVSRERKKDIPIYYGDATYEIVLSHANIKAADMIVVTIPDPIASRKIVELSRKLNPDIHITVRTQFVTEVEILEQLGANEVVAEEFEAAIELTGRLLKHFEVSREDIEKTRTELRSQGYRSDSDLSD